MPYDVVEVRAVEIFAALDAPFALPAVDLRDPRYQIPDMAGNDLYGAIDRIEIGDLTSGQVDGTGHFDILMSSQKAHLKEQFDKGRISGDQYAKAYVELTTLAMSTGLQVLLGKESTYWGALLLREQGRRAQLDAVTAAVMLEVTKAQLAMAVYQAQTAEAQYALTKLQLAAEDAKYELTHKQIELLGEQIALTKEQAEVQHAQHSDTKITGATVGGNLLRQRELLEGQKEAFTRDSDFRLTKMYLDAWITQKTITEELTAPPQLTNAEIDAVLSKARTRADMGSV